MRLEAFRFDGKRVLVVGGATGMGAAAGQLATDLGGEITVLDIEPVSYSTKSTIHVDLSDKSSVDAALGQLDGKFDVVFSCAGIADGAPSLMKVNFISQRHIIETMVGDGRIGPGAAVGMISSIGGYAWQSNLRQCLDFLSNETWEAMERWVEDHEGTNTYTFSKQAMNAFVASQALRFASNNMRINAIMPGGTDTPLARKNADTWLPFQADFREATGRDRLTPQDMGNALAFLCMDAARGINGATLVVDDGYMGSGITGALSSPTVSMLAGVAQGPGEP
jgi:NAD(P)-dependent dehydrogenase (short-subunit alcohol dehydrogenase family)